MPEKAKLRKEMGERLRAYRLRILQVETQSQMGRLLNRSQAVYNTYEQGTRAVPDDMKIQLHYEFGMNINWFLTGMGDPTVFDEEKRSGGKKKSNTTKFFAVGKVQKEISKLLSDVEHRSIK